MKKLLFVTTLIAALSISACTSETKAAKKGANATPVHEKYAQQIKEELEAEIWYYTYLETQPKNEENAYIIDFYCLAPSTSISTWFCVEENGEIDCDMIRINFYN